MKNLVLAVVLSGIAMIASAVPATNAMCTSNAAGGIIVLLSSTSPNFTDRYIAFSTATGGYTIFGSWRMIGKKSLMIAWDDDHKVSTLRADQFVPCKL